MVDSNNFRPVFKAEKKVGILIRVTIDLDGRNLFVLAGVLAKGCILCRRFPYMIRLTRRGFHVGFRHLNISEATMYRYRFIIGDDIKRIELDENNDTLVKQVLFTHKKVWTHNNGVRTLVSCR